MGFKRTPEGRVFFQGGDKEENKGETPRFAKTANDAPPSPQQAMRLRQESPAAGPSQAQIITLLKTLNERLKITQNERDKMMRELESYRTMIEGLEEKAQRNERLAMDLKTQISAQPKDGDQGELSKEALEELAQTRRLLSDLDQKQAKQARILSDKITKSATNYAALSRRLNDTETKQTEINARVENTVAQQTKLMRKVDKAIEDRARFMRKIERIEETVIQTRDSLNAKAMVVLTDQAVAGENGRAIGNEDLDDPVLASMGAGEYAPAYDPDYAARKQQKQDGSWLRNITPFQAGTAIAAVVVAGVLGVWLVNTSQMPRLEELQTYNEQKFSQLGIDNTNWQPVENREAARSGALPQMREAQPIEDMNWDIEETPPSVLAGAAGNQDQASEAPLKIAPVQNTNDDVNAVDLQDGDDVLAALENNTAALAERLNAIEPQRLTEADKQSSPPETVNDVIVAPQAPAPATEAPKTVVRSESELRGMINADGRLPNVVKSIEEQAFKGVPEAQHDLAAVYTAGHGGVKQDYDRAAFWFERAAENGIANASYNLGVLHHQGLGTRPDIKEALKWYTDAADKGHPEAQYNLGIAYIEGIGAEYDPVKATQYFQTAANNGIMEAAYNLGLIYENGLLGEPKPDEALMWYKAAADSGSPEARQALVDLAKTLEIDIDDVNRIAESMRAASKASTGSTTPSQIRVNSDKQGNAFDYMASDQAVIAQIQEYLMTAGLYPGPADGISGALTEDAIRSYQSRNGLNANGQASTALLSHMLSNNAEQGSREN